MNNQLNPHPEAPADDDEFATAADAEGWVTGHIEDRVVLALGVPAGFDFEHDHVAIFLDRKAFSDFMHGLTLEAAKLGFLN
jgi:hypothetical protein